MQLECSLMNAKDERPRAPLTDAIVIAVARLVDDAQTETRELVPGRVFRAIYVILGPRGHVAVK